VAGELAAVYGMPAHVAVVATKDTPTEAATLHEWSWGSPGGPLSHVTVPEDDLNQPVNVVAERFFWPREDGIVALNLATMAAEQATDRVATGTAAAPHLLSVLPAFAAPGWWSPGATADGAFTLYGDTACTRAG
jgi:hypothetical protein